MSKMLTAHKVWTFGDNIDTDAIMPGDVLWTSQEQRARAVFRSLRPGWVDQVETGDAIVAGRNFGMGSSRPAPLSLKHCGVGFVLCETINGMFFRNAVNYGLCAFSCPGVTEAFVEGDGAEVSFGEWTVRNLRTDETLPITPLPEMLFSLMRQGGVIPYMEKQGLITPSPQ